MMQVNLQVFTAMLDLGADPQQAVEASRWTSVQQGQGANWPHDGDCPAHRRAGVWPGRGARVGGARAPAQSRGSTEGPSCSVQAIRVAENGMRIAGSDPWRDGWAVAW
jgi:gamma-glutamyltranspeptidase